jgi:hypothetical protein
MQLFRHTAMSSLCASNLEARSLVSLSILRSTKIFRNM